MFRGDSILVIICTITLEHINFHFISQILRVILHTKENLPVMLNGYEAYYLILRLTVPDSAEQLRKGSTSKRSAGIGRTFYLLIGFMIIYFKDYCGSVVKIKR
jgi:hypothetical protein